MRTPTDEHPLDHLDHTYCPGCEILLFPDHVEGYDCPNCGEQVYCRECGDNPLPGFEHCRACGGGQCGICERDIESGDLCGPCERTARAAGRQMAEWDRFEREVHHA